jgi:hypothetical protein
LAAARSILFVLAAAVVLGVAVISAASVALAAGPSVSLILTPNPGSITAGQSEVYYVTLYQANGQDAYANSFDVTGSTIFTIAPDGSCTEVVELATHSITWTHKPQIDVLVNDARVATVHLDLSISFKVKGLVATVRYGRLVGAGSGGAKSRGRWPQRAGYWPSGRLSSSCRCSYGWATASHCSPAAGS